MKQMNKKLMVLCAGLALVMVLGAGCQRGDAEVAPDFTEAFNGQPSGNGGTGVDGPDIEGIDQLFTSGHARELRTVYFEFDSSNLSSETVSTLNRNAELIQEYPNLVVQLEGHTCSIGTQEYNLALGDRRAQSVREYLVQVGVPSNQLTTISYGEEMPAVSNDTETQRRQNRRVEFTRAM